MVRLAVGTGSWREERKECAASGPVVSPAGRLFLETLLLCAGCIRLFLAVLLVYNSPLELNYSENGGPRRA